MLSNIKQYISDLPESDEDQWFDTIFNKNITDFISFKLFLPCPASSLLLACPALLFASHGVTFLSRIF